MNKIICPECGEIDCYYETEKITKILFYDANNEPCGSEEYGAYANTNKRCINCGRTIKIKMSEVEDDCKRRI